MSGPQYKEYSDEENRVYEEAIACMRQNLKKGMHIDEACAAVEVKDQELKRLITDDFFKITIAEMRFTQKLPLEIVAKELKIPLERVAKIFKEMIEDVQHTQAAAFGTLDPEDIGLGGSHGNA